MSINKFAIKMIINALAFIALTIITVFIFNNTIITNSIALGQMSNSDGAYLLMEYYNRTRTITSIAYSCISALIIGSTIYDIYHFTKNKGEN